MRILQRYRFLMRTKIPFDQWPAIIENFLHAQGLTHHAFHYCFEDYDDSERFRSILDGTQCKTCQNPAWACTDCQKEASDALRKVTGCVRAAKENPFLGPIIPRRTRYDTIQSLNNFSENSNASKEGILSILPKIYRRYGFAETSLIYRDIDFFSRRVPTPTPVAESLIDGYDGSGITLYRSCISNDNAITLTVGSCYPGEVPDATPYADALRALLPGIKCLSSTQIIMESDEQSQYKALHRKARPFITQATDWSNERIPENTEHDGPQTSVSIASWLKKLGKRYGYTYQGFHDYTYTLHKKLPGGHFSYLELVSAPTSGDADLYVSLCGLGFKHEIWVGSFHPRPPQDASEYFTHLFNVLTEAEETVFPPILELYPPTPPWFMPE